jgi:hypothetical protein
MSVPVRPIVSQHGSARGRLPLMGGLSQRINAVCEKKEVLLETLRLFSRCLGGPRLWS